MTRVLRLLGVPARAAWRTDRASVSLTSRTYKTVVAASDTMPDMPIHQPIDLDSVADEPIRFETKISVLLRDDLELWQRLNVCAFLISGVAAANPDLIGQPYTDADGTPYLAMFRQPVLVLAGAKELLTTAHARALARELPMSVFTSDLFGTGNDRDNRAAVRGVPRAQLDLVGIAVHGPRNAVDKVFKGARMHP